MKNLVELLLHTTHNSILAVDPSSESQETVLEKLHTIRDCQLMLEALKEVTSCAMVGDG